MTGTTNKEKVMRGGGRYAEIYVNDRGFKNRPPQISVLAPTLRAQIHGNPPKVIEITEVER